MRIPTQLATTLAIAAVIPALLGIAGCDTKPEPAAVPAASSTPSPIDEAKGRYTDALERAKKWQENAELARVYRRFSGTLAPAAPTPIVYAFSSLAQPRSTFEVEFQGENVSDRTAEKEPFELLFNPVDVAQWKVPPDEALRIAEEAGGESFREAHLAGYAVLQQLSKMGAHPLQWYFRYETGDDSKLRLDIYVNADSGAIDFKREVTVR